MSNPYVVPALFAVTIATLGIGLFGLKIARTTSDLLVASRTVSPLWNASAIGGEYLSAASFLGVAGLIYKYGVDLLWYPVGFAAGYLALMLFVAAPLRRSGAVTLPDFCLVRFNSARLRRIATLFVLLIGWLYLVPQLQGAGLTLWTVTGGAYPIGVLLVGCVVTANVALGGMRAITYVQAFHYWMKLTAIVVPFAFIMLRWQKPSHGSVGMLPDSWLLPGSQGLFATYSLMIATFLGTMGLPHVLVRFYTNPDGAAARRTTWIVLGLVGVFYLFPAPYGVLGRIIAPDLLAAGQSDAVVLLLPERALGSDLLSALVAAGAFAAFFSTSSGLLTSIAGVISTDVLKRPSVGAFRIAAVVGGVVPAVLALALTRLNVSQVVGLAFAVAASSFCPLLVLGIWWRRLTAAGAAAGVLVGGGAAAAAMLVTISMPDKYTLLAQPAAWTVPLAFAVMIGVSLVTSPPADVNRIMLRLHAPDTPLSAPGVPSGAPTGR